MAILWRIASSGTGLNPSSPEHICPMCDQPFNWGLPVGWHVMSNWIQDGVHRGRGMSPAGSAIFVTSSPGHYGSFKGIVWDIFGLKILKKILIDKYTSWRLIWWCYSMELNVGAQPILHYDCITAMLGINIDFSTKLQCFVLFLT